MPFIKDFKKIITGYTQKNGAVSNVNKKFISHLPLLRRTWKMNFGGQIEGERRVIYFSSSCTMLLTLKVAYAVPVNTSSPHCFLCITFLLKTVISDLHCF